MSKFLSLIKESDPVNSQNPTLKLMDFLRKKGIYVSLVRDTDMLYIDTGDDTIAVNVSVPEEQEQIAIDNKSDPFAVDTEVEKLAATASSGLKGVAGKLFGSSAQKAKTAVQQRLNADKKAVPVYQKKTNDLIKGLATLSK